MFSLMCNFKSTDPKTEQRDPAHHSNKHSSDLLGRQLVVTVFQDQLLQEAEICQLRLLAPHSWLFVSVL